MRWLIGVLATQGCLLAAMPPPPEPGDDEPHTALPTCSDEDCGDYLCHVLGGCRTDCFIDEHCQVGLICHDSECEPKCKPDDCRSNLACDERENRCFTSCEDDDQCRPGRQCLTSGTCY